MFIAKTNSVRRLEHVPRVAEKRDRLIVVMLAPVGHMVKR